jgi:ATP-dependent DNA helicase RecG
MKNSTLRNKLNSLLSTATETEVLELKEARNNFDTDKLGRYFSALSNEANLKGAKEAWLLLGVNNQKEITGTNISPKQTNGYKLEIAKHTSPALNFKEIHEVNTTDGKVLMCEIPAAPIGMPVAWKGHHYGRDGESLGALNIAEIEQIRNQQRISDWSAQIVPEAGLDDLSPEAIDMAREKFLQKNPHFKKEAENWDQNTFLNKAKICIRGKITNTAILLLGKPESEHFLSPSTATISWILKDSEGIEKDYEHFGCPLVINAQHVYSKIRNLKYRYLPDATLFPEEVEQFDPYIIREGLNNCIAHQDYTLGGKINVIEKEDGHLIFSNLGDFIPQSVEKVIESDAPETRYRNPFLCAAMVNLKMIDVIGSGIRKMFMIQRKKFFPMPDYDITNQQVTVVVAGKIIDVNYARKLAQMPNLSLHEIILLDKVAKKKYLSADEIRHLKSRQLIEGRKPNFYISESVAKNTGTKTDYIKQRGIDDGYCQQVILEYLKKFGSGKRGDFEEILLTKLPDVLSRDQKRHKVKNNLQTLKNKGLIFPEGKVWQMSKKG